MKYLALLLGLGFLGLSAVDAQWKKKAAGQSGPSKWKTVTKSQSGSKATKTVAAAAAAKTTNETVLLEVTGMKWGVGCVKKVQSALTQVEGVTAAKVAMPGKAEVMGTATSEALIKAIETAGFSAKAKSTVALQVSGMKWGVGCVKKVQSALSQVEGVESATVAMPGTASVVGTASADALIAAVKSAGFSAECPACDAAKAVE